MKARRPFYVFGITSGLRAPLARSAASLPNLVNRRYGIPHGAASSSVLGDGLQERHLPPSQ